MRKVLGLVVLFLILITPVAKADSVWEMAESSNYGTKAGGMFGRGFINVLTSPLDLIVQTVEKTQTQPPLIGTLTGLGSGLGCTALRAGSGLLDIVSFWAPNFNGFAVNRDYSNCLLTDTDKGAYSQQNYNDYSNDNGYAQQNAPMSASVVYPATAAASATAPVVSAPAQESNTASANRMQYVKGSGVQPSSTYTEESPQPNRMAYVK